MNANTLARAPRSSGIRGTPLFTTGADDASAPMKPGADPGSPSRTAVRLAALLMLGALASSCATTTSRVRAEPMGASQMAPALSGQWVKVRSNPPTWYPCGTSADHPTDHRSGEWVNTEDAVGTRYFIPLRGIARDRRESLRREALAARSPRKVARIAGEDVLQFARACTGITLVLTPPGFLIWAAKNSVPIEGGGVGGGGIGAGSINPGSISVPCVPSMSGGCAPSL